MLVKYFEPWCFL